MQPELKEDPREWRKFTAVMAVTVCLVSFLLARRGILSREGFYLVAAVATLAVTLSLFFPRAFRSFYRAGMTVSFHIGQVMGKVLLTLLFIIVVTPLAVLLRLLGKDLLKLRWDRNTQTYFTPAKFSDKFDRMF